MLDRILGIKSKKSLKSIDIPPISILKGAPIVHPRSLEFNAQRDFSAFKSIILLMGLPIKQIDDFMSRLWEQFEEIKRLNETLL